MYEKFSYGGGGMILKGQKERICIVYDQIASFLESF